MAAQASLSLTWSKNPEDRFSRDEAHTAVVIRVVFFCQSRGPIIGICEPTPFLSEQQIRWVADDDFSHDMTKPTK